MEFLTAEAQPRRKTRGGRMQSFPKDSSAFSASLRCIFDFFSGPWLPLSPPSP